MISSRGRIDQEVIDLVYNQTGGSIVSIGDENPMLGAVYEYQITREFTPWVLSNAPMQISISRSVIIGYFS